LSIEASILSFTHEYVSSVFLMILSLPYNTSVLSEVGGEEAESVSFKGNCLHILLYAIIKQSGT
jgi:hypothetical protein